METPRTPKTRPNRTGGIFPFLAAALLLLTLIGMFSSLSVRGTLERAFEKTGKRLQKQDSDLLFLLDCLQEGSLHLESPDTLAHWNASLPEKASFVLQGKVESFGYYLDSTRLTVESPKLLAQAKSGARQGSAVLEKSVFSAKVLNREHRALALTLSAISDPMLWEGEALLQGMEAILKKARPTLSKTSGFDWEEQDLTCTSFTYSFDSSALVRGINALAKEGKDETFQQSALAFAGLIRAISNNPLSEEEETKLRAFFTGQSEEFNSLSAQMGKGESFAKLSFFEKDGVIVGAQGNWSFGSHTGIFSLFLGTGKMQEERSLSLLCKTDEKETLSLTLSDCITDNSDQAFIRELSLLLSDQSGFLRSSEHPDQSITFRYSWGREKGDLGLKILLPEGEINFRAFLEEYKKGKGAVLQLKRIEEDRKNLLDGKEVRITLSDQSDVLPPPQADAPVFPKKEEREALQTLFAENYNALFGDK